MHLWYRFCRLGFRLFFRLYLRARSFDAHRVPAQGGVILACNHVSFLDPPMVGAFSPRQIHYLARKTLFRNPLAGWLLRSWGVVPVDQERGDVAGLKCVLDLLGQGKAVLIFPEGTRGVSGQLQPAQPGFGWLVAKSGAPVLPVRVWGTEVAMPRGVALPRPRRVAIHYGELLQFDALLAQVQGKRGEEARAIYAKIGAAVMEGISQLSPCKE